MTASKGGETAWRSSMKSPRCGNLLFANRRFERIGSWAILRTLRTFDTGMSIRLAISSESVPVKLLHSARGADQLDVDHVNRDADGPRLIGDRPGDRLPDPPRRIGRELVARVLELVHRLHQADVAFLDQIEELQAAIGVSFLAIETTSRRFASTSSFACSAWISPRGYYSSVCIRRSGVCSSSSAADFMWTLTSFCRLTRFFLSSSLIRTFLFFGLSWRSM